MIIAAPCFFRPQPDFFRLFFILPFSRSRRRDCDYRSQFFAFNTKYIGFCHSANPHGGGKLLLPGYARRG
jgi:hypothetical protein